MSFIAEKVINVILFEIIVVDALHRCAKGYIIIRKILEKQLNV